MRSRIVRTFVVVVMTLVAKLTYAELTPHTAIDLGRYLGKWYEVASIPNRFQDQCVSNTTAEYFLDRDERIKVVNSCETANGERSIAEGRAKVVDKETNAVLTVTFLKLIDWLFIFGENYVILDVAPDYSSALVAGSSTKYAWVLSRTPVLSTEAFIAAEAKFKSEGYDTCKILTSVQDGGLDQRVPLCELVQR